MAIVDDINRDITSAMKAKEAERLSALRMVKTALKLRETELPGGIDDAEAGRVLNTLLKQRRDAAEQYRAAGREDLALKEENEARIIQTYLPAAASNDDMLAAVNAAISETAAASMKDMGAVMKSARAKLEGKTVDGKALSDLVKARLSV
ncbi:MAG TPA: GatB/YqeY domain-containing protein [Blastocatellia bacterium]|nr:GatB/YqeY domain-containing protein [Blastocatellia bacterium]